MNLVLQGGKEIGVGRLAIAQDPSRKLAFTRPHLQQGKLLRSLQGVPHLHKGLGKQFRKIPRQATGRDKVAAPTNLYLGTVVVAPLRCIESQGHKLTEGNGARCPDALLKVGQ